MLSKQVTSPMTSPVVEVTEETLFHTTKALEVLPTTTGQPAVPVTSFAEECVAKHDFVATTSTQMVRSRGLFGVENLVT